MTEVLKKRLRFNGLDSEDQNQKGTLNHNKASLKFKLVKSTINGQVADIHRVDREELSAYWLTASHETIKH